MLEFAPGTSPGRNIFSGRARDWPLTEASVMARHDDSEPATECAELSFRCHAMVEVCPLEQTHIVVHILAAGRVTVITSWRRSAHASIVDILRC